MFASKARSGLTPLLSGLVCGWGRKYGGVKKRFQPRGRSHLFTQKGPLNTIFGSFKGLRGIRPPLAEEAQGRMSFRALREGVEMFAS